MGIATLRCCLFYLVFMPELPEVETIRLDLEKVLVGATIADVTVRLPKLVRSNYRSFRRLLRGRSIEGIARRAKLLIFSLSGTDTSLLVHLKMTGQLIYRHGSHLIAGGHSQTPMSVDDVPNKYSHLWWSFTNGSQLYFNDLRQFGYVQLVSGQELEDILSAYGVEPLSSVFTVERLGKVLHDRRINVKQVLLDQTVIAGLGNIYVDEACFYAGVKPTRQSNRLSDAEIKRLHRGIRHILQLSIKHRGTTFNNYRDAHGQRGDFIRRLKVYGRAGEVCRRCRVEKIQKTKIAGRGTHYCSNCQR